MKPTENTFSRAELLLGRETMEKLQGLRVILFGIGGVGSWCGESLVRSGVGHLTIVDFDLVAPSNVNRQLLATTRTIGRAKVEVLRERLLEINPEADIQALRKAYNEETALEFTLGEFDYVIDCIDSLKDKALLLYNATRTKARVLSSMGAALKVDPTQVKVAEFWKVRGCPLGAALRKKMKHKGMELAQKVQCVYSEELLENRGKQVTTPLPTGEGSGVRLNGSLSHITGIFGFTLAGLVIKAEQMQSLT